MMAPLSRFSDLPIDTAQAWVKQRLSEKRYKHTKGVAAVARRIAERFGCDAHNAELSGWLHDACKEVKDKELVRMARGFGLPLDPILEAHGYLLHGPVAAEVIKSELQLDNPQILDAIAQHTLGEVPMTDLSKIVFLADCLEESRPESYTKPIWKALDIDASVNLDAAIVVASDQGLVYLIEDRKPIHPKTVAVRNYYLSELRKSQTE